MDEDSVAYVTMEAASASKPVITLTDSGGVLQLVVNGETGCVASPDAKSIAEAIDLLCSDAARSGTNGTGSASSMGFVCSDVAEHDREAAVMNIAWFTPYQQGSAIAKFSSLVVPALAARGHSITLFSSDKQPLIEHRRLPEGIELLHWSLFETSPELADAYDLIVYNIGDHLEYHFGVLKLIDRYPGVCIFHDFYLVDLFLGWCATEIEKPLGHCIVASIYGQEIAEEFWARTVQPDFQEWAASHVPMTEWVARKALAAVAHSAFYQQRLADASAGPVTVIPLASIAPAKIGRIHGPKRSCPNSHSRGG